MSYNMSATSGASRLRIEQDHLADKIAVAVRDENTSLHKVATMVRTQFALMGGEAAANDTKKLSDLITKLEENNAGTVDTLKGTKAKVFFATNLISSGLQVAVGVGMGLGGIALPPLAAAATPVTQGIGVIPGLTSNAKEIAIESQKQALMGKKTLLDAEQQETRNSKEGKTNNKKTAFEENKQANQERSQTFTTMTRAGG